MVVKVGLVKKQLHRTVTRALLFVTLLATAAFSWADVQILDSSFVALPGNRLEVRFDFDGVPPQPRSYMIEDPARVVLDLWGAGSALGTKRIDIKSGQVDSINFAEVKGRIRIIANLYESAAYEAYVEGSSLYVIFGSGQAASEQSAEVLAVQRSSGGDVSGRTAVKSIDFRRLEGDEGRVIVDLTNSKAGVDISEEGSNVIVNLIGATLPADLEQRMDVQDFSTPITFIDAVGEGNNATILIKPSSEPYEYLAYQSDNQLIIDFKPLTSEEDQARLRELFPYTGDKLNLDFQEIDLRRVLKILVDVADMNLVMADNVIGNLTLRLKNVPWDQALDLVLKANGLDKRVVGNVMMIAPTEDILQQELSELESNRQVEDLAPLQTAFLQVNYAKADEIVGLLGAEQGLMSERGTVRADPRTNTLLIQDTETNISKVRRALKKLDVPVRQVMIEARIVTVEVNATKELGVRWGLGAIGTDKIGSGDITIGGGIGDVSTPGVPPVPTSLNVDLGATTAGSSTLALGVGIDSALLQFEISALESDGKAEVVSQPKIITADGQAASIESGSEVPYQTVDDGTVSIEFKPVVLSLYVTPQITPDNNLILDLEVSQDSIGEQLQTGEIIINTNQLQTQVLIGDGETLVLGGVFKVDREQSIVKVPLLGDIPVLGKLFQRKFNKETKRELLVFITPKIIRDALSVQ